MRRRRHRAVPRRRRARGTIFYFGNDDALSDLARHLAPELYRRLVTASELTGFQWALLAVRCAPYLPHDGRLDLARRLLARITPEDLNGTLAREIDALGPLGDAELDRALELIRAVTSAKYRVLGLAGLARCATDERRVAIAGETLDRARQPNALTDPADVLGRLAPVLEGDQLRRALRLTRRVGDEAFWIENVGGLLRHLDPDRRARAMRIALDAAAGLARADADGSESFHPARLLCNVAADLPEALRAEAVNLARALPATVWRTVAPWLPNAPR
jgi:hypothetical protein